MLLNGTRPRFLVQVFGQVFDPGFDKGLEDLQDLQDLRPVNMNLLPQAILKQNNSQHDQRFRVPMHVVWSCE